MAARIDQINSTVGFPERVQNVPPNYPSRPEPDKISLLFKYNSRNIYHRFSPYTTGDNIFGIFPNKQPFVYRYIDEAQESTFKQLPAAVKTLAAAGNITQGTIDDVVRVSKFLISPQGIQYNIKQLGLQRLNPFDETRVYNPLTPILATVSGMTFGIGQRPRRHIEGNLLAGLLNSVTSTVGINFQSQFKKPDSTAGDITALPNSNIHEGKGMIRGKTATDAQATLTSKWPNSPGLPTKSLGVGGSLSKAAGSFLDSAKNSLNAFFGNPKKSGGKFRADEGAYELMRISKGKLDSYGKNGQLIPLAVKYINGKFSYEELITSADIISTSTDGDVVVSDLVINYGEYVLDDNKAKTKFNDDTQLSTEKLNDELRRVIAGLNNTKIYNAFRSPASYLLPSDSHDTLYIQYDNWTNKKQGNRIGGTSGEYEYGSGVSGPRPKSIDASVRSNPNNLRMASTFLSDGVNMLGVLNGDMNTKNGNTTDDAIVAKYPNWQKYNPYEDDLIAFFFYDVVNQKYIPFRATVKGISEGNTAFWDELRFIGRADQLYSYNGFSRTLSFTFNVVVNSIVELLPTWQKINYMASCVKPSNYTDGAKFGDSRYSKFIVPPMFMLTIGDMYKFQPIVITSINVNIPDDASWETLNEYNAKDGWSYLNGIITSNYANGAYGQLPREVEIAITCNVLEKERAIMGGSHFGHQPRVDDWENKAPADRFLVGNTPYLPAPTDLHKQFAVMNSHTDSLTFELIKVLNNRDRAIEGSTSGGGLPADSTFVTAAARAEYYAQQKKADELVTRGAKLGVAESQRIRPPSNSVATDALGDL